MHFSGLMETFVAVILAGIISFKTCNKEEIVNTSVFIFKITLNPDASYKSLLAHIVLYDLLKLLKVHPIYSF